MNLAFASISVPSQAGSARELHPSSRRLKRLLPNGARSSSRMGRPLRTPSD
jgi:hypothetical protein